MIQRLARRAPLPPLTPPPGWSVEEDRREEFLALSWNSLSYKALPVADG